METKIKVAIDVHGVLDDNPFFKEMAKLFVAAGHEVHIVTGAQYKEKLTNRFKKLGVEKGIHFTHFFSIADHLLEKDEKVRWEDSNNPWFDEEMWNVAKGEYCAKHKIDIHFDDTEEYANYFSTPIYIKK